MKLPLRHPLRNLLSALVLTAAAASAAQAAEGATAEMRALLDRHYAGYAAGSDPAAVFAQTTHPAWANCSANGELCQSRDELAGILSQGLHKLVPDMKWKIIDVIASGDTVVVRGEGSGTPSGPFMGIPASGRSFKVMSIDIHTMQDGKIAKTYHFEDWAAAAAQLSAK
jgi:predicted ester cyclase